MPQRPRKYAQISFEIRERLIEAITIGESMKTTCNILYVLVKESMQIMWLITIILVPTF